MFGERKLYDFEDPVDKLYSYGKKVDKPTESDKDHESQNIMMIKNMIDNNIPDTNRVKEYDDPPSQVTHSTTTASIVDNLQSSSVKTIEISSSEESGEDGWSMIGVIFLVAISGVISVLLISMLTFVLKNYLFFSSSRDEGKKVKSRYRNVYNKIVSAIVTSYSSCSSLDCEMV